METKAFQLIFSSKYGKRDYIQKKAALCIIFAVISFIMVEVPYIWQIYNDYGFEGLTADIQNIRGFEEFSVKIPVVTVILLIGTVKLLGLIISAIVMMIISYFSKRRLTAYIVNTCLFILPVTLYSVGFNAALYAGTTPFIFINKVIGSLCIS